MKKIVLVVLVALAILSALLVACGNIDQTRECMPSDENRVYAGQNESGCYYTLTNNQGTEFIKWEDMK